MERSGWSLFVVGCLVAFIGETGLGAGACVRLISRLIRRLRSSWLSRWR